MKNETVYNSLILFVIFILIKKLVSLAVEIKLPTYKDLNKTSTFWQNLVKLRTFLTVITFIWSCYFLLNYNLNFYIKIIFFIIAIHSILYFLVDERLIYLFLNKSEKIKKTVYILDTYGDSIENLVVAIFSFYVLIKIFY